MVMILKYSFIENELGKSSNEKKDFHRWCTYLIGREAVAVIPSNWTLPRYKLVTEKISNDSNAFFFL